MLAPEISKAQKIRRIAFARGGAELVSATCAMGALGLATSVLSKPLNGVKNAISNRIIEPNLEQFEALLDKLPSVYTPEDKKEMQGVDPTERAHRHANGLVNFSTGVTGGFAGQIAGQMMADKFFKVPDAPLAEHTKLAFIDRGAQIGAIIVLNSILANPSIHAQQKLTSFMQKTLGMDEETAESRAGYLINWQIPNISGMAAAIAGHYAASKNQIWRL